MVIRQVYEFAGVRWQSLAGFGLGVDLRGFGDAEDDATQFGRDNVGGLGEGRGSFESRGGARAHALAQRIVSPAARA